VLHEPMLSINQVLDALQPTETSSLPSDLQIMGISTDTRCLRPGELFVALKGENFDGHSFIADAVDRGAAAVIVEMGEKVAIDLQTPIVRVPSTVQALGALARAWRQQCRARVVAVTGSAGKTTTKDMVVAILSNAGPLTYTHATENNEIGVAQTLLRLKKDDEYCVLEFGMRGAGQIDYLARVSLPDVAVITNIGEAHLGLLGSREAVAQAKAEVLPHLPHEGTAVLNRDDYFFDLLANMTAAQVLSFGAHQADVCVMNVHFHGLDGTTVTLRLPNGEQLELNLQVPGRHNASNAAAAAAIAYTLGVSPALIEKGLNDFTGSEMRSQVLQASKGYSVINDAYNASPTSMVPALEMLAQASERKLLVFGDMLELGPFAQQAHIDVVQLAIEQGVDMMIGIGPMACMAADHAAGSGMQVYKASDTDQAITLVRQHAQSGDTILVKGSRGMRLEKVVEELLRW
jgi:UDP-N-acetylmuramoyl-tripeptide--D-alanyl-D-alanine ligase